MKNLFSRYLVAAILCGMALVSVAQTANTPYGINFPLSPTAPLVTMPDAFTPASGLGGSILNFSRTYVPQVPVANASDLMFSLAPVSTSYVASVKTVYLNGWGQPVESILRGGPSIGGYYAKDIVSMSDLRPSRTATSFLPYSAAVSSTFLSNPFSDQQSYYNTLYPNESQTSYSQAVSNTSVASGIVTPTTSNYQPGASFVGNSNGVTATSAIDDGTSQIESYMVKNGALVHLGLYAANMLTIKTTTGQHDESSMGFYDMSGNLVCKKVHAGTSGTAADWLVTYYVYDDMGKLTYILTPKQIAAGISSIPTTINDLAFQYSYNVHGQPVTSQKPGKAGADVVVYDYNQRPVLLQSPLLQSEGKYMFRIYDNRDRLVMSGILTEPTAYATVQGWLNSPASMPGGTPVTGSFYDYLINGFGGTYLTSTTTWEVDNINYYDTYPSFCTGFNTSFSADYVAGVNMVTPAAYMLTQGMLTASQTLVKDGSGKMTTSQYYYDQKGHLIQTSTLNPWNTTNWDVTTMQYNFTGQMVKQITLYNDIATNPAIKVATLYTYDMYHNGRLETVQQQVNTGGWRNIASYQYDDMGRVKQKLLGGVEEQDYTFNIRGQLNSINADYTATGANPGDNKTFGCILDYDFGFSLPRYDGQISGILWRGAGTLAPENAYGYNYDPAVRLLSADFRTNLTAGSGIPMWDNSATDYSMSGMQYDENGNINYMQQMGMPSTASSPVPIDRLSYAYASNSNKLTSVADAASTGTPTGLGDFFDGNTSGADYNYDPDGNLSEDLNKGITNTTYNELDKPVAVTTGTGTISYTYDASGTMIERTVTPTTGTPDVYRYWGPFVYKNDALQYILHQEGRTRYITDSPFKYDFFVKDHLGNVRSVVTSDYAGNAIYVASHEIALAGLENLLFSNIEHVRAERPASIDPEDARAARLNARDSTRRIGTAIMLHMMAGDQYNISAESYWQDTVLGEASSTSYSVVQSLLSTLAASGAAATLSSESAVASPVLGGATNATNFDTYLAAIDSAANPDIPQAFINYLVFDEQMHLIPEQSGAIQVGATPDAWQTISTSAPITVAQNGYLVVFISNAHPIDVFFDHLSIPVFKGRLLQQQDYYPFGLPINEGETGTTAAGDISNNFKFEGNEQYNDLGLNLQNFNARQYDYQIGRFVSIDPMADQKGQEVLSPYHFCGNNPANNVDPTGMIILGFSIAGINFTIDLGGTSDAWYNYVNSIGDASSGDDADVAQTIFKMNMMSIDDLGGRGGGDGFVLSSLISYANTDVDTKGNGSTAENSDNSNGNGTNSNDNSNKSQPGFTNYTEDKVFWVKPEQNYIVDNNGSWIGIGNNPSTTLQNPDGSSTTYDLNNGAQGVWASGAYAVQPQGGSVPYAIDGFTQSDVGYVYKTTDYSNRGTTAFDLDHGGVGVFIPNQFKNELPFPDFFPDKYSGGLYGPSWLNSLHFQIYHQPDRSWDQLFIAAGVDPFINY